MIAERWKTLLSLCVAASPFMLAGCTQSADALNAGKLTDGLATSSFSMRPHAYTVKDRECLARAMFFESNRSSRDGLVAVGTVVMNRLKSGEYADTVCGVVGQKGQFAPGVLSRPMNSKALPDVQNAADAVLQGERHPKVKEAMFFHTAGRRFPYKNMHYVLVAGGNAFYEKRSRNRVTQPTQPAPTETMVAAASPQPVAPQGDRVAAASTQPALPAQIETAVMSDLPQTAFSYEASPEAADAIGALIVSQDRPLSD